MKALRCFLCLLALGGLASPLAAEVIRFEHDVRVDGNVTTTLNLSAFDLTSGLGTIAGTVTPTFTGGPETVGVFAFFDHELSQATTRMRPRSTLTVCFSSHSGFPPCGAR